ncbi:efflux RND transporter periplasmic adaptor subunit [Aquirufa aurantiipilula]|uniref:Efflux RND transporter periplasmic adaptor subunit n=1 Tax=Aquirufa aurantiipilula TaxID=2696561 RepID=A0ABT6BL70_9BACT|nr:efflux RND transporter periplasmic adaptor subunit [Aquirufa aurantiipilula]MBZ1326519.1 efflux RND transporter periplasmic adaptor subunit [Aquirufa aurantiipilula]MDF5690881.1 efflux RND transporter periplasmic adaptor subunit [Aquirufa aurantiipilula]
MNKRIIYQCITLFFIGSMFACGTKETETAVTETAVSNIKLSAEQKQNAGIVLGELEEKEMASEVSCTGLVDVPPISSASISLPMAGYVKSTFELLPGKQVRKGQILATITSLDYIQMQQEYIQALSQQTYLTSEKSRQQVLNSEEVGSKKKLQMAEADYSNVQAQVKSLGLKLEILGCDLKSLAKGNISSYLELKAPIDGYIVDVFLSIGKYVQPTDELVKMVGIAHKHVELKVFERDLGSLQLGQTIQFEAEGMQGRGKVFLIGKQVDLATRTTSVHGHFNNESDELRFTVGQFINAKILVGNQKMKTIPQAGLARVGKGGFIYVENPQGLMEQVPVKVISSNEAFVGVEPLKSLPAGKVVISGASALEAIFAKD